MCGIVGICYTDPRHEPDSALVRAMAGLIAHRGPDDDGFLDVPGAALGMRRLSIIDVAGGSQPVFGEDGTVAVVYNGEIYNFQELQRELEQRGHTFRTRSDTEVIVHGYEEYGTGVLNKLNGMFALALWDAKAARLLLARDRLGKKPLHYCVLPDRIIFGSEIKSLLLQPGVSRELDYEALDDYLTYGHVLSPRSIFRSIRKLPPGGFLTWSAGALAEQTYWSVSVAATDHRPEGELLEELNLLLRSAVKQRLISDVPLGAFLSGGVDSSAVAALMARQMNEPVKTFSIGFAEEEFNELEHARAVATHLGTDHHELIVSPRFDEDLPAIVQQFDEPFADSSAIPTYYVSKMARQHVTVTLSGDGGDECFGGYMRYTNNPDTRPIDRIARKLAVVPLERLMPFGVRGYDRVRRLRQSPAETYSDGLSNFPAPYRRRLYTEDVAKRLRRHDPARAVTSFFTNGFLEGAQNADLHRYLPDDILVKVDRMSMLNSLEVRCPLLDHRIVEFMARVPARHKIRNGVTKYLFKRAMEPLLPREIIYRPKMGFGVPLNHWFRNELTGLVQETLLSKRFAERGLFNQDVVRLLFRQHRAHLRDHQTRLWTLVCFELWARTYLDGRPWQATAGSLSGAARHSA